MMIYIFDNGESYSDHAIYFVSTEGYDPQDAEKILRHTYPFQDDGDARSHDHTFLVATVEKVEWYAGQPQMLHEVFHWRYLSEEFFKSLKPETQRKLYQAWRDKMAEGIRRSMRMRDNHRQPKRARREWSQFGGREHALAEIRKLKQVGELVPREPELCQSCGKNPAEELHTCPYQEDINDDHETLCNCCDECRHNCLMDI